MKKIISTLVVVCLFAVALAGCGNTGTESKGDTESKGGTVATDGSTSMEKVIGYLSEAYMEENADVIA